MKSNNKKQYIKPTLISQEKRIAAAHICCGLGTRSTCGINHSRIS